MAHPYGIVFGFLVGTVSTKWGIPTGLDGFLVGMFSTKWAIPTGLFWFFARYGFYKMGHPYGIVFGFSRDTVSTKWGIPTGFDGFLVGMFSTKWAIPTGLFLVFRAIRFLQNGSSLRDCFWISCRKSVTPSVPLRRPIL
ncbi:hypothetical protein [Larkinella sp. C7]|jgi:hypothetical protein|uniref:hypothetical protein n=1 Tax=Larkinella sp. C7 TaxID=2576607 RepID=UPI001111572F|nr:hypothetical protein [Larkinella sp. C7]